MGATNLFSTQRENVVLALCDNFVFLLFISTTMEMVPLQQYYYNVFCDGMAGKASFREIGLFGLDLVA